MHIPAASNDRRVSRRRERILHEYGGHFTRDWVRKLDYYESKLPALRKRIDHLEEQRKAQEELRKERLLKLPEIHERVELDLGSSVFLERLEEMETTDPETRNTNSALISSFFEKSVPGGPAPSQAGSMLWARLRRKANYINIFQRSYTQSRLLQKAEKQGNPIYIAK